MLLKTIERVRSGLNPTLEIQGIILTMFDKRNNLSDQVASDVRAHLGDKVYQTVIPRNVRISEAPSHGLPALVYDLRCPGSQAYIRLASELIQRERARFAEHAGSLRNGHGRRLAPTRTRPPTRTPNPRAREGLAGGFPRFSARASRSRPPRAEGEPPGRASSRSRFSSLTASSRGAFSMRESSRSSPIRSRKRACCSPFWCVRRRRADSYEIVAGERRWRAAQLAKLHESPGHCPYALGWRIARDRHHRERPARRAQRDRRGARLSGADQQVHLYPGTALGRDRQEPLSHRQHAPAAQTARFDQGNDHRRPAYRRPRANTRRYSEPGAAGEGDFVGWTERPSGREEGRSRPKAPPKKLHQGRRHEGAGNQCFQLSRHEC